MAWRAPEGPWHPDFDRFVETEMLRKLATRLKELDDRYGVRLVVMEPGYMHFDVMVDGELIGDALIALDSDGEGNWRHVYNVALKHNGMDEEFEADEVEKAAAFVRGWAMG